jgi:hypothetical protein
MVRCFALASKRLFDILRSRAQVLFCALVSGYEQTHLRLNIPRLEEAIQYGETAGDR